MNNEKSEKQKEQRARSREKIGDEEMKVQGCDCSIIIKSDHGEMGVPYSEETIREAVTLLVEEAAIEGDGTCRAPLRKSSGVTGCVRASALYKPNKEKER